MWQQRLKYNKNMEAELSKVAAKHANLCGTAPCVLCGSIRLSSAASRMDIAAVVSDSDSGIQ